MFIAYLTKGQFSMKTHKVCASSLSKLQTPTEKATPPQGYNQWGNIQIPETESIL